MCSLLHRLQAARATNSGGQNYYSVVSFDLSQRSISFYAACVANKQTFSAAPTNFSSFSSLFSLSS